MPNLDLLDRKILFELDLDSRQPITKLAKTIGASKETVNFRLKRLVKEGYIKGFLTTVYTSNLNRYYYKIFYKFHKTTPSADKEIINFIQNYPKTAWFGNFEGPYDSALLIMAQSVKDLELFLAEFRRKFGDYILEQEIHTVTCVHRFNLKFFHSSKKLLDTKYPIELKEPDLDAIDYKLIQSLANNSRATVIELAQKLHLDSSTIIYRIKNLRKKKIFGISTVALNFEKFNLQHFQINFVLKNHDAINNLITFFSYHPKATFTTTTLGKYDLAVELAVKDNFELRAVLDQVKEKYSEDIINHDTFLIVKEYNVTWFPG